MIPADELLHVDPCKSKTEVSVAPQKHLDICSQFDLKKWILAKTKKRDVYNIMFAFSWYTVQYRKSALW